jgi:hypothetical protein
MDLAKSQKIVRILGILSIIAAVCVLIGAAGLLGIGGFGAATMDVNDEEVAGGVVSLMAVGIVMLVSGILTLLQGIFSLRAAKDASKAGPLWVISLISLIGAVASLIVTVISGGSFLSGIFSLLVACFVFYLANNIKKNA